MAEIAAERGLSLQTVEGHIADAIRAGEPVDYDRLVGPGRRTLIEAALAEAGGERLKPAMELLGDGFSDGELRFVQTMVQRQKAAVPNLE